MPSKNRLSARRPHLSFCLAVALLSSGLHHALADANAFTNDSGDDLWANAANWEDGVVPNATSAAALLPRVLAAFKTDGKVVLRADEEFTVDNFDWKGGILAGADDGGRSYLAVRQQLTTSGIFEQRGLALHLGENVNWDNTGAMAITQGADVSPNGGGLLHNLGADSYISKYDDATTTFALQSIYNEGTIDVFAGRPDFWKPRIQ